MNDLEPFLTYDVRNAVFLHMQEQAPKEACGYIVKSKKQYDYVPCKNVSRTPERTVKYNKADNLKINTDDNVIAYVHTHPAGPNYPSKKDMETQILLGKPSVIASMNPGNGVAEVFSFGEHLLDLPLEGRDFRSSVTDCYEAIRSWVWQNTGRKMRPYARVADFWNADLLESVDPEDRDMYKRFHVAEGFTPYEVDFSNPQSDNHPRIGDLVLMRLGGVGVMNHAGIYVGNNQIYHHRVGKKSTVTTVGYIMQAIRMWCRPEEKA